MKQLSIDEKANRIKHLIYYGNYKDEVLDTDTHKIDWAIEQMFIMAEESLRFKMPAVKELFWKRVALLSHQPIPAKIDLEELRERFRKAMTTGELFGRPDSSDIFNWFSPFLSNNTEGLQKEVDKFYKLEKIIPDYFYNDSSIHLRLDLLIHNYIGLKEDNELLTAKLKECDREWISVEDRLPEVGDKFNVVFEDEEGYCADSAEWDNKKRRWEHVGIDTEFTGIKFYKPLPNPPKYK